jgi:hypothetical protein
VLANIQKCDQTRVALGGIHPIARPGVVDDVRLAAEPDVDAVDAVIEDGQKYEGPLEDAHKRQVVEELDLVSIGDWAFEGLEVREQVLEKEGYDGDYAEQRMQLVPEKGVPLGSAERLYTAADYWRGRLLSSGHGIVGS